MCKHADTTFIIKRVPCAVDGRRPTVIRTGEIDGKIINHERRQYASVYDIVIIIIIIILSTTVKLKYLTTLFWRRLTVGINRIYTQESEYKGNNLGCTRAVAFLWVCLCAYNNNNNNRNCFFNHWNIIFLYYLYYLCVKRWNFLRENHQLWVGTWVRGMHVNCNKLYTYPN